MKGTKDMPMCGFSNQVVQILNHYGVEYKDVNILEDPEIRVRLSEESGWPTIPQLFVSGELIGGADIAMELHQNGELLDILDIKNGDISDEEGEVSFVAHYIENGKEKILQEVSNFIKEDGKWYYNEHESRIIPSDPTPSTEPFTRDQPKVGRNDPCPCGSKKKYKKCCGK